MRADYTTIFDDDKFIKGLYVTASPVSNKGALINFSITNGISKMALQQGNQDGI